MLYHMGGHALDLTKQSEIEDLREENARLRAAISAVNEAKEGSPKWWAAISRLKAVREDVSSTQ